MNGLGFRQTNSWLHTWSGLLLGWLLYAIFFTGTVSFFRDEVSFWMKPELHASKPDAETPARVIKTMQQLAPDAASWSITLPTERNQSVQAQWYEQGERMTKGGGKRVVIDATSGQTLQARETRGANFLYRFHFELYGMPRVWARWIVGIATMFMLIAIISGVIVHKKILRDFFTFRPKKGQRSWMDAHNVLAVISLPFHFMITYSGLLLFMFMMMPWGLQTAYDGDTARFFAENRSRGVSAVASLATQAPTASAAPLTPIAPLIAQAQQQWSGAVVGITVSQPGTTQSVIELRQHGGDSLIDRGQSKRLRFDGATGMQLPDAAPADTDTVRAIYNVFTSLHLLRFADISLRWLSFIAGVLGTGMIATGLVLWVVKRRPMRAKAGTTPFGDRLVRVLNIGTLIGLPLALGIYFWANRLLPEALPNRSLWEIRFFFLAWLLCFLHPLFRSDKRAWIEQLLFTALVYVGLPIFSFFYLSQSHLLATLSDGRWLVAGVDLILLAVAAVSAWSAYLLIRRPVVSPKRVVVARKAPASCEGAVT
ncbi:PepSY domain-containing protein [Pusillimonas sp. ANT_WB101]|uniref:PepSY-associated TM helix domain-containing protein n=1 Tax=Pusillimonas sp. ANT_WB101 TaxID=2597356 RepID=UPI0011F06F6E|nr:PepSY-associated TM helix domain-containing protein [Pusillimonas sp. ANT_WB101]KAA0911175.1 PepSY domain-containing protein [Pusillimonas sp. ANT_WB101]